MDGLVCTWEVQGFSATAIYTGENRLIEVRGSGTCPGGGFTLALEAVDGGIHPDRSMLSLGLVETAPASGTTAQTPVEVSDVFEASQEVTKVGIRHVGVIEVVEPA